MIVKKDIENLVLPLLAETQFLVDVNVNSSNSIKVFIDDLNGLNIDACKKLSRKIEASIDPEKEDFDLEVSSPGLGKAFKVKQQYQKCLNKIIEVTMNDGLKHVGVLMQLNQDDIHIEIEKSVKAKKTEVETETVVLQFSEIKTANEKLLF